MNSRRRIAVETHHVIQFRLRVLAVRALRHFSIRNQTDSTAVVGTEVFLGKRKGFVVSIKASNIDPATFIVADTIQSRKIDIECILYACFRRAP